MISPQSPIQAVKTLQSVHKVGDISCWNSIERLSTELFHETKEFSTQKNRSQASKKRSTLSSRRFLSVLNSFNRTVACFWSNSRCTVDS